MSQEVNQVLEAPYGDLLDICWNCGGEGGGYDYDGRSSVCPICHGARYLDVTDEALEHLMADADQFPELYAPFAPVKLERVA